MFLAVPYTHTFFGLDRYENTEHRKKCVGAISPACRPCKWPAGGVGEALKRPSYQEQPPGHTTGVSTARTCVPEDLVAATLAL